MKYILSLSEIFGTHSYQYKHLEQVLDLPVLVLCPSHQDQQEMEWLLEVDVDWTETTL